jgi:phosphoenolpyruvate synthase/pyruvate phosphate dikinase
MTPPLILPLDSADASLAVAGSKGANLARLARAGLPVPPGFLLSTSAYDALLAANRLAGPIRAALEGINPADPAEPGREVLACSPVSPGVAEGVVRVVLDPHGARLAPGEILVCPGTDPGWTPLFLAAGGLVTEVGGLITQGSVVAREYGIPAVVGVHQATTRLRTGQRVRVDGTNGRVEVLGAAGSSGG